MTCPKSSLSLASAVLELLRFAEFRRPEALRLRETFAGPATIEGLFSLSLVHNDRRVVVTMRQRDFTFSAVNHNFAAAANRRCSSRVHLTSS